MKRRVFDLGAFSLVLEVHKDGLEDGLLSLIGELETKESERKERFGSIALRQAPAISPPENRDIFYSGDVEHQGFFEFDRESDAWSLTSPGLMHARFPLSGFGSEITVTPDCPPEVAGLAGAYGLDHAIGIGGQCLIHAASLDTPDGSARIIIHAPSGTGKTTIALALAEAGYRLCSDDVTVIGPAAGGGVVAWGLPRDLKVHRLTAAMLGWLRPIVDENAWNDEGEQTLDRATMRMLDLLADLQPKPVIAVIALQRASDGNTSFKQLEKYDGLFAMMQDNINFGPAGLFPGHEDRLDLYSAMLSKALSFELQVSGNPESVLDAIAMMVKSCRS